MAFKYAKSRYTPANPEKYVGKHMPFARSSWETHFMIFLDKNPNVLKWASEAIKIPYQDPITKKHTIYVPDFFMQYVDKNNIVKNELIEIKPENQQVAEKITNHAYNQVQFVRNQAKWRAAQIFCKQNNMTFRVINEHDMFHMGTKKTRKK